MKQKRSGFMPDLFKVSPTINEQVRYFKGLKIELQSTDQKIMPGFDFANYLAAIKFINRHDAETPQPYVIYFPNNLNYNSKKRHFLRRLC
jgi:hypothetical protein